MNATRTAVPVASGDSLKPLLEARGVSKAFGTVLALRSVDLSVLGGEVHGLVGANGAGKSTLIRILAGDYRPDSGVIKLDGRVVDLKDTSAAANLGLNFIHQELNLVPKLTALQNMTLGLPKSRRLGTFISWRDTARRAADVVRSLQIGFPLGTAVEELSVADRWLVSLGRALMRSARLIAMDEPTASLSDEEAQRVFRIIRGLATDGVGILYVSHRLDEITELCDRATILRDGKLVDVLERSAMSKSALVRGIVGRELVSAPIAEGIGSEERRELLRVVGLTRLPMVKDVSFSVYSGEVLGIAGLVGSGRTETARLIFGADKMQSGRVIFKGKALSRVTINKAVGLGMALVPEERRSQGLILAETVTFNSNLASLTSTRRWRRFPLVSRRKARARARQLVSQLDLRPPQIDRPVGLLSGGNQQKVVLGKWLLCSPELIFMDEPTRGVDVGARADIYKIIREFAATGRSVVVISSEFEEFKLCCDRVLVMREGAIAGELAGTEISEDRLLKMSYSQGKGE